MHLVQSPYLHFCVCQINEAVVGRNIVKLNINLNVLTFTNSKFTVDHFFLFFSLRLNFFDQTNLSAITNFNFNLLNLK